MLLFGYKRLPDASRSLGRSLRIFRGEMNDLRDDPHPARATDTTPTAPSALPASARPAPTTAGHIGGAAAINRPQQPAQEEAEAS